VTIEVLYFDGCPNADATRALVRRCLAELALDATLVEREGDYPSPTVRVDGRDVMGEPAVAGRACRLDVPTSAEIETALRRAAGLAPLR
jgi:hypothetical protein